jgi:ribosomal protein L7Ae-like RNA K-turn-binding protein
MSENKENLPLTNEQECLHNKIYSFIGLARKAGAVCPGETLSAQAVKQKRAYLVLVTGDASDNTKEKIKTVVYGTDIPLLQFGEKAKLGKMLGKVFFSVIAITENRFAQRIMEMIVQNSNNDNSTHGGGFFEQTKNS